MLGIRQSAHECGVRDQFLEPQKVPRRLGRILRNGRVGHFLQRRIEEVAQHQRHRDGEHEGRHFGPHQVWPTRYRVLPAPRPTTGVRPLTTAISPYVLVGAEHFDIAVADARRRRRLRFVPREAPILAHAPEVQAHERGDQSQRQHRDVKHVEADQRLLADIVGAQQQLLLKAAGIEPGGDADRVGHFAR